MPTWPIRSTFVLDSHDNTWRYYYTYFFCSRLVTDYTWGYYIYILFLWFEVDCYITLTISYAFKVYVALRQHISYASWVYPTSKITSSSKDWTMSLLILLGEVYYSYLGGSKAQLMSYSAQWTLYLTSSQASCVNFGSTLPFDVVGVRLLSLEMRRSYQLIVS